VSDDIDHGMALLKQLRQSYPARVRESELLKTVAQSEMVSVDTIRPALKTLVEQNLVVVTRDEAGEERVTIAQSGIDMLEGLEPSQGEVATISPWEMESKLIATYDSMKTDMEALKKNLERNQQVFGKEMGELRKSIADHDQFLRTYFVRIMESISVFIGIFGIVVVMMVTTLNPILHKASLADLRMFVVMLPLLLVLTIIPTLYIIKRVILEPRRPPVT
jgi:DNA-binding PadR family transcriptional regulator